MGALSDDIAGGGATHWLDRRWIAGVLACWLAISLTMLVLHWPAITDLLLRDTDDNLRLAQVRALMAGQGWFDLTQYRLAPPTGADIHWSRLPDLSIAGFMLVLRPLLGAAQAEQWAVALATLLPLGFGLFALALTTRRLVDGSAWPLALLILLLALPVLRMWMPLRLDHHGWQLALIALALAGLVDPRKRRGGVVSGLASALSLAIGLEMLPFLALIGGATALFWVRDRDEAPRIAGYGAALGGGTALAFLVFASSANHMAVCDALSPVWLSVVAGAAALLVLLALMRLETPAVRLLAATGAGLLLVVGFALLWPDCLGRPENISSELQLRWLDSVREARPLLTTDWRTILLMLALPLTGLAGYAMLHARAATPSAKQAIAGCAMIALASLTLIFWQMRFGPAAQLLAIPGAAALGWIVLRRFRASSSAAGRVGGTLAAVILMTAIWTALPFALFPKPANALLSERQQAAQACLSGDALAPIAALPPGTILSPIDLGPRLIVMTPHSAIAGPYHRNGVAMLDILDAFSGTETHARATIERYQVDYVVICPGLAEERLYGEAGLYENLKRGDAPDWLESVALPDNSPFMAWRVR